MYRLCCCCWTHFRYVTTQYHYIVQGNAKVMRKILGRYPITYRVLICSLYLWKIMPSIIMWLGLSTTVGMQNLLQVYSWIPPHLSKWVLSHISFLCQIPKLLGHRPCQDFPIPRFRFVFSMYPFLAGTSWSRPRYSTHNEERIWVDSACLVPIRIWCSCLCKTFKKLRAACPKTDGNETKIQPRHGADGCACDTWSLPSPCDYGSSDKQAQLPTYTFNFPLPLPLLTSTSNFNFPTVQNTLYTLDSHL
jgi:hypothetical protein